jgi:alpha-ketoglutarate-dependent 2,4-dichlorophenoxyacetate dioxygenase
MAIEVRPLHRHFGAEVIGADLASCDAALMAEFEATIGQYGLLLVRGTPLDDEGLTRFGGLFGPLQNLSAKREVRSPIAPITNLADDGKLLPKDDGMRRQNDANGLWHIDSSYLFPRATYSFLHARIVPSSGGETEYCDTRVAWDALDETQRAQLEGLSCDHSIFHSRRLIGYEMTEYGRDVLPSIRRKLVQRHEPSGRNALIIASHVEHIEGLDYAAARALIDALTAIASAPERVYRHHWTVGDLLMWDNRCVLHRGRPYAEYDEVRDLRSVRNDDIADEGVILRAGATTVAAAAG